ncbi:MAG: metal-dependent transcriptional regulator [Acidobacteria bacterium]|nr:metal-dependent transcriptional regulator [Acidobacteriota bacterium]
MTAESASRHHHPAFEEYLETLFQLAEEGVPARPVEVARRLGVSRPAVTEMTGRLVLAGYVRRATGGSLALTALGSRQARTVVRRHRLAERLLIDVLGLPWHLAHEEACRLEHAITPAVEARLEAFLGRPATSPFGTAIPRGRAGRAAPAAKRLRSLSPEESFDIVEIREGAQLDPELLKYLVAQGLKPGRRARVRAQGKDGTEIAIGRGSLLVPARAAALVMVRSVEAGARRRAGAGPTVD